MKCVVLVSGLGIAALVAARGTQAPGIDAADFSFAKWVDTIAVDPRSAMSPQQAVVAFNETLERRMCFCCSLPESFRILLLSC